MNGISLFYPGSQHFLDRRYFPNSIPPTNVNFSIKSEKIDSHLERQDFETIIKDRELFWLAYCKAVFPHQNKKALDSFFVFIEGTNINISGEGHTIKKTQDVIEELRAFFVEGLKSRKTFEIFIVPLLSDCLFRKESPLIDLRYINSGYCTEWYCDFIKPALPQLAEFCGALYTEDRKNQLLKTHDYFPLLIKEVQVIRINWQKQFHLIYPISPKCIPEQEELGKALYSLYQKQQFCDFSLKTKDQTIKVHSNLLYVYGGPVFQGLLTSNMKETIDKAISFAEYSQSTVEAFIDFIYLGGKAFSEKMISSNQQNTIDLFELFELANTYQIETLIDCCTNLISLMTTKQDLEIIEQLATTYNNKHLKQLCDYLSPEKNTLLIKV